tara:strand:+ start:776 stop:1030 length:255 start_codon:yes stop_codon:yes gene_type:complete
MNKKINKYFNKKSFNSFGSGAGAVGFSAFAVIDISAAFLFASTWWAIPGLLLAACAVGQANKWQEEATGTPLWKPRLGKYGFGL